MRVCHSILCISLFIPFSCYSMEYLGGGAKKFGGKILKNGGKMIVVPSVAAFGASWFCKNYLPNKKLDALEKKINDWEKDGFPHNGNGLGKLKKRVFVLEDLLANPSETQEIKEPQTSNNQEQKSFIASIAKKQIKKLLPQGIDKFDGRITESEKKIEIFMQKITGLKKKLLIYQDAQKKTDLISKKLDLFSQKADTVGGRIGTCEKKIEQLYQMIRDHEKRMKKFGKNGHKKMPSITDSILAQWTKGNKILTNHWEEYEDSLNKIPE